MPPDEQETFISVCVPFTEKEYRRLRSEAARLATGQPWEAVRERMGLPGKPFKWLVSEKRGVRMVVSQGWWLARQGKGH